MEDCKPKAQTNLAVAADVERRAALKRIGRFVAVTPPVVTLLLSISARPRAAQAASPPLESSKKLKTTEGGIDESGVLDAVASLTVDRWRYKEETGLSQQVHIGPYAEDFRAAFGIGDGVTINTTDALGVCLAAIKALAARVESLEAELKQKSGEKS
jgi:hypothetical protein